MTFRRIIGLTLIVALDLIFAQSAIAELAPQWYGVWKSASGQESLTISASKIITEFQREDEPGKFRNIKIELKWSDSNDPNPSKDEERFGYSKKRISPSDVAHIFENAVNALRVGEPDFSVSDPKISRQAIKSISPGVYKIVWTYFGGDCGNNEYILDGDKILEMDQCKYRVGVRLFKRENALTNGVPATHTSDSQRDSNPVPTGTLNGIWEGKVQQGNMTYPVTMTIRASELNEPSGTIDYPGLGCGGSVVLTKVSEKTFLYREIIERGQDKCINGGLLFLTVNPDGSADWKYLSLNNPVEVLATAKLRRASAPTEQSTAPFQLDPQWLGKWKGFSTKVTDPERSTLEISAQAIKYSSMVGDEGRYHMSTPKAAWIAILSGFAQSPIR